MNSFHCRSVVCLSLEHCVPFLVILFQKGHWRREGKVQGRATDIVSGFPARNPAAFCNFLPLKRQLQGGYSSSLWK